MLVYLMTQQTNIKVSLYFYKKLCTQNIEQNLQMNPCVEKMTEYMQITWIGHTEQ